MKVRAAFVTDLDPAANTLDVRLGVTVAAKLQVSLLDCRGNQVTAPAPALPLYVVGAPEMHSAAREPG